MICASCGAEVEAVAKECAKCKGLALLEERYRLIAVLGRGANGITYRAERVADGKVFAVKEMPLRTLESAKAMELFEREARVLRQLDHRAIPRYEDDFVSGEGKNASLYLVQELVSGRTLDDELEETRYDVAEVFAIVAEIAEVLEYLHRRSPSVVHRDVKPKNVMRRDDGRLVLIDFGSVRDALGTGGGSTVAGTFGYMAPEQLAGRATPASDVYALGALAIRLLTRKEPDTLLGDDHRIDVRANVDASDAALLLLEEMLHPSAAKRLQRASDVQARARKLAENAEPEVAAKRPAKSSQPKPRKGETRRERKLRERKEFQQKRADERAQVARARARERERGRKADAVDEERQAHVAPENGASLGPSVRNVIWVCVAVVAVPIVVVLATLHGSKKRTTAVAKTVAGAPELYARPIAVDVNGDGVEDMIVVSAIDAGPDSSQEDGEDTWGKENGHFHPFVQAIDGKDGRILYSLEQDKAYTSLGNEAKTSERIVLVATMDRLGVARIPVSGKAKIAIHDLRSGKELKTLSFEPSSGRACENQGGSPTAPKGTFSFNHADNASATTIDLARAAIASTASAACDDVSTSTVADAPADSITDRTVWTPRFSRETTLRTGSGPWGGRSVVQSGGLGVFVVDANVRENPLPSGPTVTIDNGGGVSSGRDNRKIDVVAFDPAEGTTRFDRSLASLGFNTQVVDHIEGTEHGPLLFFTGTGGLALLDPGRGDKKWVLALPKGQRLSSYTLSQTRAYLHVFAQDYSVYGFLSKKLASRILVVDLATGRYLRSVPDGPLEPDAAPRKSTLDPATFKAVVGCACVVDRGTPVVSTDSASMTLEQRREAMRLQGRSVGKPATVSADARPARNGPSDAGDSGTGKVDAPSRVRLKTFTQSSVESGGRRRFTLAYAFEIDGKAFVLPHYDELRETIAPPRSLEEDVVLGLACGGDTVVVASDRVATAWSLSREDELWTVELPVSRGEAKTTLGGSAALSCAVGRIEHDRVFVPSANGPGAKDIVLKLEDGALLENDAGVAAAPSIKR